MKAMAYALPADPKFCGEANQKVCDYYISNQSCCCQEETAAYRQCLFNEVLVPSVGLISTQCFDTCSQKGGGSSSGGGPGTGVIVGVIVALLILVGICGATYIYLRRNQVGDLPTTRTDDKKKSFLASLGFQMPMSKKSAPKNKVDEEAPAPSSSSDDSSSSSSSSDSSSSSSNSDDSSGKKSSISSFGPKGTKRTTANKTRASVPSFEASDSSGKKSSMSSFGPKGTKRTTTNKTRASVPSSEASSSVTSSDFRPKQVPKSRNVEDALPTKKPQGSQGSVPSNISADSLEKFQPAKAKQKSSKQPMSAKKQSGSPTSFSSSTSNGGDSKRDGRATSRQTPTPAAAARSSDDTQRQDRQEMMEMVAKLESTKKNLTSQLHDFEAQAFALKLENDSSSKKLKQLVKDRAETTRVLSRLEKAKDQYEMRLRDAKAEADALRKTHVSDAQIIAELRARNEELGREAEIVRSIQKSVDSGSDSSPSLQLSKDDNQAPKSKPKSRLPQSGGHKLENTVDYFNGSWTSERVHAFEKWEGKIKRAPGLC
jgi:hypothetical protein